MAGHSTVGVNDDFAAGKAAVTVGAADYEAAGGVDVIPGFLAEPLLGQHRLDDLLHHPLPHLLGGGLLAVLGGEHHGINGHRLAALIAEGDLALGVRLQPGQGTASAHLGLPLHQAVGVFYGGRHQHIGLVGGVAEHQALVAGALLVALGLVHPFGDVGGLGADGVQHRTGLAVEAALGVVVADVRHHLAYQAFKVNISLGAHLARHQHHAGFHEGLAGHTGLRVLFQHGIQNRIGYLVGHFVRVALGYGFRGE